MRPAEIRFTSDSLQTSVARLVRVGPALDAVAAGKIRRVMELRHFKWDAQIGDVSALAPFPLMIGSSTWHDLAELAERLFEETLAVERELLEKPSLQARIALPRPLRRLFARGAPTPAGVRVMCFDFHATAEGWRVSEVNSDVPGGFTEATNFSALIAEHVPGARPTGDPTRALVDAIASAVGDSSTVALTSAPGHIEDLQVVAHLAAALRRRGLTADTVSVNQLRWSNGHARFQSQPIDVIFRFYQAEWLARLPPALQWTRLFVDGGTPVINPGTAALSESKRVPLIWDELRSPIPMWRRLLPETRALADAPWRTDDGWLLKSAYSNTGDTVCIRSAMTPLEWTRRSWAARLRPSEWLAQRRFTVAPVFTASGPLFPCIGVFVINGRAAGAYARVSLGPVIDFSAQDVALLIYDDV